MEKKRVTASEIKTVRDRLNHGVKCKDIAKELDVDVKRIYHIRKSYLLDSIPAKVTIAKKEPSLGQRILSWFGMYM